MVRIALVSAALLGTLGLAACDVQKTQEGDVTLPKYDVKTPDVNVTTEQKTVEVPTIKKEERTIEVPKVEVTPAKDK